MARWYGAALTTGSTVEEVQSWPDRIRAVTADAVQTPRPRPGSTSGARSPAI